MLEIEAKVRKIISDQLNIPYERVASNASLFKDLGADSLDKVELIMAIEEEFGITIYENNAQNIQTVQEAIEHVHKLCGPAERTVAAV